MIYGYFDESGEPRDGHYVVAGFIGRKRDWKNFISLWTEARGDRGPLHMRDCRLGSHNAERRYGDLLKRLGKIPKAANLKPFSGSVRTADFADRTNGTIAAIVMQGYTLALSAMVEGILHGGLPRQDRIEFIFEEQIVFAQSRAEAFAYWRNLPDYKTHHGKSRIGKDSSMEKGSPLLEASDYLAYAILQNLIDSSSQKAVLTSPLLAEYDGDITHRTLAKEQADALLDRFMAATGVDSLPSMDREKKKYLTKMMKNSAN